MSLKSLFYRLCGKQELFQIYVNLTPSTPDRCLDYHGEIVGSEDDVVQLPECNFHILRFPVGQLDVYREKSTRMKELAEQERRRRELFAQGRRALKDGACEKAVEIFKESVQFDEYLDELKKIFTQGEIQRCLEVKQELKRIFIHGYKEKFGLRRYERYPERMREDRKKAGLKTIEKLFDAL